MELLGLRGASLLNPFLPGLDYFEHFLLGVQALTV